MSSCVEPVEFLENYSKRLGKAEIRRQQRPRTFRFGRSVLLAIECDQRSYPLDAPADTGVERDRPVNGLQSFPRSPHGQEHLCQGAGPTVVLPIERLGSPEFLHGLLMLL